MEHKEIDLLIVGGGINGLAASLMLSKQNIKTVIIDAKNLSANKTKRIDGRGIALSKGSEDILREFGIWEAIEKKVGYIRKIVVTEDREDSLLEFDAADVFEDHMGAIIEMDDLNHILVELVRSDNNIEIHDSSKVTDIINQGDFSIVETEKRKYKSKLVLAADGKNSILKELLKIDNIESDYNQIAAVFNIRHKKGHNQTAYEIFTPNGPLAVLPTKEENISSVVWVERREIASLFSESQTSLLNDIIQEKLLNSHGSIEMISELNFYPLYLKLAKRYFKEGVLLLGDSLHYLHPIAGQGLNLSLRDIVKLVELIRDYSSKGFEINSKLMLEEFTRNRLADNMTMTLFTDGINRLFSNNSVVMKKIRNVGLDYVSKSSLITSFFVNQAMGKGKMHV